MILKYLNIGQKLQRNSKTYNKNLQPEYSEKISDIKICHADKENGKKKNCGKHRTTKSWEYQDS